jgi:hypothetical protein
MNVKLISVGIAALGMVACSPDITTESNVAPAEPAASSAPAQPGEVQKSVEVEPAAVPAAGGDSEKNTEAAAPAAVPGMDASTAPAVGTTVEVSKAPAAKTDTGAKKTN